MLFLIVAHKGKICHGYDVQCLLLRGKCRKESGFWFMNVLLATCRYIHRYVLLLLIRQGKMQVFLILSVCYRSTVTVTTFFLLGSAEVGWSEVSARPQRFVWSVHLEVSSVSIPVCMCCLSCFTDLQTTLHILLGSWFIWFCKGHRKSVCVNPLHMYS